VTSDRTTADTSAVNAPGITRNDALTWVVVLIRVLHVGAVVVALAAMYRPAANAYFRS
jgi:hypothetical protein